MKTAITILLNTIAVIIAILIMIFVISVDLLYSKITNL